jgi:hypothetical protein
VLTAELQAQVMARIIAPTVKTLADEGMPYSGVLFAGLMLTREGPKLIEYNARFGDPECQVMMSRLQSDLGELLLACAQNRRLDRTAALLRRNRADRGDGREAIPIRPKRRAIKGIDRPRRRAPRCSTPAPRWWMARWWPAAGAC